MVFALILALAIAIVAVIFALQNTDPVTVTFFSFLYTDLLAVVILAAVAAGILIGVLVMTPGRIKSSLSNARNRKKIGSLEAKLTDAETPAPPPPPEPPKTTDQ